LTSPVDDHNQVLIGRIVGAHGVKGTSKVRSYAESPSLFKPGRKLLVREESGASAAYLKIDWVKPHTGVVLMSFRGITDRNQAEALIGRELFISKDELPDLEEDVHYWFDLIGIEVYTIDGELLGYIESIIETGSNDVYVVKGGAQEVLIPALESVVLNIDTEHNRMEVDLPEGLT
jgi:16S rRNA processing protein RimM